METTLEVNRLDALQRFLLHISPDVSPSTLIGYRSDLERFEGYYLQRYNCPFDPAIVTASDVKEFIDWLRLRYHNNTIRRIHCCIRSAFRVWQINGFCADNPALLVKLVPAVKTERTFLEDEQVKVLIDHIDDPLIKLATEIMAYTGIRINECIHLRVQDIDLENQTIFIAFGKGRQQRFVPIHKKLFNPLQKHWQQRVQVVGASGRLLATKTGRLSQSTYTRKLHEVTDKLGWSREITAHVLRHSFATRLVTHGANIAVIQKLLGHNDFRITETYLHAPMWLKRQAVDSL